MAVSRRRFVQGAGMTSLGLLMGCGRLPGQPGSSGRVPRVGYLTGDGSTTNFDAFLAGLRELGYVPGQNIGIEFRTAEGERDREPRLAADLVALPVDVIVTTGAATAVAAMSATATIPIVMAFSSSDPVADGLVASLARPGGNITGLSALSPQLGGKRLELLQMVRPSLTRVGVLWEGRGVSAARRLGELQEAAGVLAVHLQSLGVQEAGDLESAFAAATSAQSDALIVLFSTLTGAYQRAIVDYAAKSGLPTMYEYPDWIRSGGLIAYGPSQSAMHQRAATYVDRILKGAKAADLPVEQPTTFELVINLHTAQALGLTIPQDVLLQATEVIQ